MGDPYWRYSAAAPAAPPSSSDRGSIPKPSFPGYLPSEVSTLTNYYPYSSRDLRAASSDFPQKDILPSRAGAYGVDDFAGIRSEPGISGLTAGTSFKGYPSSFEDPSLLVRQRDVAPGTSPGIPDATYENSMRRADGPPVPAGESNILFVDGLPTDCTRREIGHLFRPFIGFREIRVVHKEPRRRGDKAMVLCFVEFTDAKCALTAMEALQGYKFDDKKQNSPLLRIHFAHFPFRLPSNQDEQRFGGAR
ncbi:RNA-binding protein 1-like isoform X1 [Sesamum indicum]|uniref:RNA-binding protein 1-like isoform X1 n=1 Tax=Sesamum indicum TaxID=4182 RepID=A0A6I9UJ89_SESIN|nr:RNA-binding protein 1-like isoform X1 [Sesamum indicum]